MNGYSVVPVPLSSVRAYVEEHHYTKSVNGLKISQCYGLYDNSGLLIGAAIFGQLSTTSWKKYAKEESQVVELRRMVVADECPRNTNTWFMSRALKHLKNEFGYHVCVSYADPHYDHVGIVYQAANWIYVGKTAPDVVLETPDGKQYHSRAMRTKYKGELKPFAKRLCDLHFLGLLKEVSVPGKHIYLYRLKKSIKIPHGLPYPKKEIK